MKCSIAVFGRHGARMARALVFCAMAGTLRKAELRLVFIGVPETDRMETEKLLADYTELQRPLAGKAAGPFAVSFRTGVWPQTPDTSLKVLASGREDRLLTAALFTRREAAGLLLTDAAPVASLGYHRLLRQGLVGALREIEEDMKAGAPLLLMGSLAEACCGAGAQVIGHAMKEKVPGARLGAVLETSVYQQDDDALCKAALNQLELPLSGLWLVGLPEDCQIEGAGPQICDWLAALGTDAFLGGREGGFAFHAPGGPLDWTVFGGERSEVQQAFEGLIRTAWLMKTDLLPAISRFSGQTRLLTRVPRWYAAWLGKGRKDSGIQEQHQALANRWQALAETFLTWLDEVQTAVPYPMRLSEAVREGTVSAENHYRTLLKDAGMLALLQYNAEVSGLRDEEAIHRYSSADTEEEATLKRISEMEKDLLNRKSDQQDMNRAIGGRASLRMMERVTAEAQQEAEALRLQVQEGKRRIARAEQLARLEDRPKVDTAKARLGRLERRLAMLDGMARQAAADLRLARQEEQRLRAPSLPNADTAESALLKPETLRALICLKETDSKAFRQEVQELQTRWPWPEQGPRALLSAIDTAGERFPEAPGFIRLMDALMERASMER
ncbi:MAG: hypothetical protein IKP40_07230 [Clostridia bacterium]|nr:hypothetical protein [Clostridia bacterium]